MSAQRNLALMRRLFREVWNEGKLGTINELLEDDAEITGPRGADTRIRGRANFIAFIERTRRAFPDVKVTVEDAFGNGNRVVVRWSANMTQQEDRMGMPTSSKPIRITGMAMARMRNERIVEGWSNWDQLPTMK